MSLDENKPWWYVSWNNRKSYLLVLGDGSLFCSVIIFMDSLTAYPYFIGLKFLCSFQLFVFSFFASMLLSIFALYLS